MFYPLSSNPWGEEEALVFQRILEKGRFTMGESVKKFESSFADKIGIQNAIMVSSGSMANLVGLAALFYKKNDPLKRGDEVIVPSHTFIATWLAVSDLGAIPIPVEPDIDTYSIDISQIEGVITEKTKAIIPVHLYGQPVDMDKIIKIAKKYGLYVIEDCAQAHGAKYKEKKGGSIGHIACWSFCQDKIISTGGEGGMVTTNDEILWRKMWSYKDHGKRYETKYDLIQHKGFSWTRDSFGTNFRMTEMQAAIGRIQLKRMIFWHNKRLSNANKIWNIAKEFKGLSVPNITDYIEHAAYKCYLFVRHFQFKTD